MALEMKLNKISIAIVVELFAVLDNDYDKVYQWLVTKNLNLGGMSPLYLINRGQGAKVVKFIQDADEGNLP